MTPGCRLHLATAEAKPDKGDADPIPPWTIGILAIKFADL